MLADETRFARRTEGGGLLLVDKTGMHPPKAFVLNSALVSPRRHTNTFLGLDARLLPHLIDVEARHRRDPL